MHANRKLTPIGVEGDQDVAYRPGFHGFVQYGVVAEVHALERRGIEPAEDLAHGLRPCLLVHGAYPQPDGRGGGTTATRTRPPRAGAAARRLGIARPSLHDPARLLRRAPFERATTLSCCDPPAVVGVHPLEIGLKILTRGRLPLFRMEMRDHDPLE